MLPKLCSTVGFVSRSTLVAKTLPTKRLPTSGQACYTPNTIIGFTHHSANNENRKWSNKFDFLTAFSVGTLSAFFAFRKRDEDSEERKNEKTDVVENGQRIIHLSEVQKHKSVADGGIWVIFQGKVYDVTNFVEKHPGGDKILLAAGSDVAPYWRLYAFHHEKHVIDILREYYIGDLPESEANFTEHEERSGPYANDPERHPALVTISKEPRNAETPAVLIPDYPITPNELFFVRNHLPVPDIDINKYRLEIKSSNLVDSKGKPLELSLKIDDLKKNYPVQRIVSTVVCAGNRRSQMAKEDRARAETSQGKPLIRGLDWQHAALSTAEWTGVRLVDLLVRHLLPESQRTNYMALLEAAQRAKIHHVQFEGADFDEVVGGAYGSSLPIAWALDPRMDILLAFEMNGQPIPRDHGFPVRVIIPGSIGARQVKWLTKITLSNEESQSYYQQTDYKLGYVLGGNECPDYRRIPAILDYPVQSAICSPQDGQSLENEGSITVRGYAFSGGGRGILSVRVSADGGKTWHDATLAPVSPPTGVDPEDLPPGDLALAHRTHRQWAWTLWETELPIPADAKEVEIICCARDSSNNVQPERCEGSLNVRGLVTNSWHRVHVHILDPNEK
ncbi:oxidoreductase molybdopterin binding domain protein [Opisthorchis viverrini]|uniref:sulfite oxidase n=2 Tax=Opisthorchis viverrini TaxID=6198 RepID=A0A075AI71_OPIVI|nr:hypothetical protein T265_02574 [Opisthorchis viverrini]KER31124.1 hypothetical protein T265_02574 [Opisthorchis viverrini]OON22277.1 oxidoreductase molybdopterin binding domain protein [Opisthorchis viverrini]